MNIVSKFKGDHLSSCGWIRPPAMACCCGFCFSARTIGAFVFILSTLITAAGQAYHQQPLAQILAGGAILPESESRADLASKLDSFAAWLKQHEGETSHIRTALSHNARIHTQAAGNIARGSSVLYIPAFLTVNADDIRGTDDGVAAISQPGYSHLSDTDKDTVLLALWLSVEAGIRHSSAYQPFLNLLPSSIVHLPIAFSLRHQRLLNLTAGIATALSTHFQTTLRILDVVHSVLSRGGSLERSARFAGVELTALSAWAVLTVQTTALPYPRSTQNDGDVLTLVPGINLINHGHHSKANQPSALFSKDPNGKAFVSAFTLRAARPLVEGDDVFASYFPTGKKYCQMDTLLKYGFTEVAEWADCASLELDVSENVFSGRVRKSVATLRRAKLVEAGMLHADEDSEATMMVTLRYNQTLPVQAAQYMRLANLDMQDVRVDHHRAQLAEALSLVQKSSQNSTSVQVGQEFAMPAMLLMQENPEGKLGAKRRRCSERTTSCQFGSRSNTAHPGHVRSASMPDLTQAAIILEQMQAASGANGATAGGLASKPKAQHAVSEESRKLDLAPENLKFSHSSITGQSMVSYQNEIRTMRLFLRLLADSESSILTQLQDLSEKKLVNPDRTAWSLTEKNIMRVHEGTIRTLRWHAQQTERAWLRLLYQPDMFWEPSRLPSLPSSSPWRGGMPSRHADTT